MRQMITREDVEALEFDQESALTTAEKAEQLVEWAERGEVDLGPDTSARSLLVTASEMYEYAGDLDRAWQLLDRAEHADGLSALDVRACRINLLLQRAQEGDHDRALELAASLRTDHGSNPWTCHFLAETFQKHDDTKNAMRWFNIGLRVLEDIDEDRIESGGWDLLLIGRHRLRQQLGHPPDAYDDEATVLLTLGPDDEAFDGAL